MNEKNLKARLGIGALAALLLLNPGLRVSAQQAPAEGGARLGPGEVTAPTGPVDNDQLHVTYVRLGSNRAEGFLYEPKGRGANARVAILYAAPQVPAIADIGFNPPPVELASRGYRVLYVRHIYQAGDLAMPLDGFAETSRGISYLRSLPGVERVVLVGWGLSAASTTLYASVAANGPAACQYPQVLVPCKTEEASGLAKPDGLVLLDPGLAAADKPFAVDPAYEGNGRTRQDLDEYSAANGYDAATGTAKYSADFRKRYYAAQSARNNKVVDDAIARRKLVDEGKGPFLGDEPMSVPGTNSTGSGSGLFKTDLSLLAHTKRPHILLKADGSQPMEIIRTTRKPSSGVKSVGRTGQCCGYTLRRFMANDAIRTTKDFAMTEDDVLGVEWRSSNLSVPGAAEGVAVPSLVMSMTCFMFVVPSEVIYDHLAAKDKTLVGVEGTGHLFTACGPEFGDTKKRTFDYITSWLSKSGRF
ncbi:hypothetical protein H7F51_05435 [Novosphingobium flavum]|uniref:Alpha/beta hydrolase n=1 Tax=Novosphingobium flavum TaxID=1778672 RepID=A0A7X1KL74_9SPHN|nr:hypothetical protein [Novosphingobium flavum]MBC2664950.1 hypothetical protein [Novosphingobium flavum]